MKYKKGDLVTRVSHNHDVVFKIINIVDNTYILKGIEIRLYADANEEDLKKFDQKINFERGIPINDERSNDDFFYMPPKILQLDGDSEFLKRCLNYYKENNVYAVGKKIKEENMGYHVINLLKKYITVLNEREKKIILLRYGLLNEEEQTQKEIAKKLHISRSYVSRIEKRALIKMLREFLKNN